MDQLSDCSCTLLQFWTQRCIAKIHDIWYIYLDVCDISSINSYSAYRTLGMAELSIEPWAGFLLWCSVQGNITLYTAQ